ncbi:hypothetical protein I4U23_020482 [Adineta vaga]|nr:hypothetical protein I4U23_020482 [Adineta vaga]
MTIRKCKNGHGPSFFTGVSFNQPKFSPYATWEVDGSTFADNTTIGVIPAGIFIDTNNTIYSTGLYFNIAQIWFEGNVNPSRNISNGLRYPYSVFVTGNGDIYVDNGLINKRLEKSALNTTNGTTVMYVEAECAGLFIDVNTVKPLLDEH